MKVIISGSSLKDNGYPSHLQLEGGEADTPKEVAKTYLKLRKMLEKGIKKEDKDAINR